MAATVHFNVVSATINGVSIVEPLSVDITYDSTATHNTSSADVYSQHLNVGPKSRSATVTGLSPTSMLAASVAAAAGFAFVYKQAGDASANVTLTIADNVSSFAVGQSFEWDSGNPGEFGQATATFIILGSDFSPV